MMKRTYSVLFAVFIFLFTFGIASGLLGRVICTRDNQNFAELQPESMVPDVIQTVLHDQDLGQIYVCYNDANCVNVYSESGEFLWAVATPYIRNSYFELQNDKLIIYGDGAYLYSSANGQFLGYEAEENLNLSYNWENEKADDLQSGEFCFDSYQIYQVNSDGSLGTIVARPWWYHIFNFGICLLLAFAGAVGTGVMIFLEKRQSYHNVKKKVQFESKKAKAITYYLKVTSIIQLVYAVLDIISGFYGGILCIGILPIAIHFIVSNWIIWNILDHISASQEEIVVLDYWRTFEIATFVVAFLSVLIAAGMAG